MTQRQYIINVICAILFQFGLMATLTGFQPETVGMGIGWIFSSVVIAIFNNIKIKE